MFFKRISSRGLQEGGCSRNLLTFFEKLVNFDGNLATFGDCLVNFDLVTFYLLNLFLVTFGEI